MKSYADWKKDYKILKEETDDAHWNSLRYIFGGNREVAPTPMVQALKSKVEQMKMKYARENGSASFEQLPIESVHNFAKDMVATVIKTVYGDAVGSGRTINVQKIGQLTGQTPAPPANEPPTIP